MPTKADAPVLPGARAIARYVRTSPTKARRMINLVRGLPAKEALTVLQFAPQAASEPVYKVLASAIANAENNERLDPDSLLVSEATAAEETAAEATVTEVDAVPAKKASRAAKAAATEPTDEPKTEEPKTEEPKVEEPKAEEPKAEEPKKAAKKAPAKKATTEKAKAAAEEETE